MENNEELTRDYKFSDATLSQLTDDIIDSATRDTAVMDPEGVTTVRLDALKVLNDDFKAMPDDEVWIGIVREKTEEKEAAFDACESMVRTIRRMAANKFGEKSGTYSRFGFEGIARLSDSARIKAYYRVQKQASDMQSELASEGLTPLRLTDYFTLCENADEALDKQNKKIRERDEATENRIRLGNGIYAEVVKITNTGQSVWYGVSEAKYNDYVIDNFVGGTKPPAVRTGNVGSNMQLNVPLSNVFVRAFTMMKFLNTMTTPASILTAQFANTDSAAFDNGRAFITFESLNPTVEVAAADLGYDKTNGFTFLMLYANAEQAAFRIEIRQSEKLRVARGELRGNTKGFDKLSLTIHTKSSVAEKWRGFLLGRGFPFVYFIIKLCL